MAGKKYGFFIPQIKCPFCRETMPRKYLRLEEKITDAKRALKARITYPMSRKKKEERKKIIKTELKRLRKEKRKLLEKLEERELSEEEIEQEEQSCETVPVEERVRHAKRVFGK